MSVSSELRSYPFATHDPFLLPEEFAWLRANQPVSRVRMGTGDEVWLVTRHQDARAVLSDRRFSRNVFRPDAARLIPGVPVRQPSSPFVDPPAHTRWRKLVSTAFTARRIEGMRARVHEIVDGLLDQMDERTPPVDLMRAFAYPLPIAVICELLGIAAEEHETFSLLADAALTINDATMEEKVAAHVAMSEFSRLLIGAKRERPGTDLLSELIAVHDDDDGRLSEDELVATILAILIGGYESTVNQIGKALLAMFCHPDQLQALRADPSLIGGTVEETLRYAALDSGFGSPRYATADVQVGDVVIPQGSTVLVIRQSANRDEAAFEQPDRLDVRREANQHVAFGWGPHVCLGSALARLELEVGIGSLVRRFPRLQLAVPMEEIPWDYRITVAGPRVLPVSW